MVVHKQNFTRAGFGRTVHYQAFVHNADGEIFATVYKNGTLHLEKSWTPQERTMIGKVIEQAKETP